MMPFLCRALRTASLAALLALPLTLPVRAQQSPTPAMPEPTAPSATAPTPQNAAPAQRTRRSRAEGGTRQRRQLTPEQRRAREERRAARRAAQGQRQQPAPQAQPAPQ